MSRLHPKANEFDLSRWHMLLGTGYLKVAQECLDHAFHTSYISKCKNGKAYNEDITRVLNTLADEVAELHPQPQII